MSFLDIVDFTRWSSQHSPRQLIESLNVLFSHFDREALQRGLEKIKTIGDCYMAVSGISDRGQDHVYRLLDFAVQAIRLAPEIAPGQAVRTSGGNQLRASGGRCDREPQVLLRRLG